ncbi:NAD-dependent epimerase [Micromonospora arborensis]|uniref:NAD-dependent epimerase n=1 Tax=Micromonospora arborensis TaxID=2116518 RepID=A0A318NGN9_9ACTN|nr:NAD(P)H-binding protein [Micromonospora arborensis]PYC68440.1 NAD-dependent epimerase [Micromonospora arborensis]
MRIVVLGANGGTGRRLVQQALDAGHDVRAVTRQPESFPVKGPGLEVVAADVTVDAPVDGADVVLSTLGVPFSRQPVLVYSRSTATILAAMRGAGVRRLVVVSSSATEPHRHAEGGFLLNRVIQPLVTATIGKSTYDDMRVMERLVRDSNLDWTIVRPSGLFDSASVTRYRLSENCADGIFTSREDLAACLLAQATDTAWVGRTVAVTTGEGAPTLLGMLRREAFGK